MNINLAKPYLLITCGPTGSGKGSLPEKIFNYTGIKNQTYESILIDDIVAKSSYYKEKVINYINELKETLNTGKNNTKNNNQKLIEMILEPTDEMIVKFNEFYYETRGDIDCISKEKCSTLKNKECITCDMINDKKLETAFKKRANILFETTGTTWPTWLLKSDKFTNYIKNYNIIIAWSIVEFCELLFRNKKRASIKAADFLNYMNQKNNKNYNNNKNGIRLPEIRKDEFIKRINDIIAVFKKYNKKTELCNDNDKCIRLILIDNNTKKINVLYDSKNSINNDNYIKGSNLINLYKPYQNCDIKKDVTNSTKKIKVSKLKSKFEKPQKGGNNKFKTKKLKKMKTKKSNY